MAEMPIGAAVRRLSQEQPDKPALTCEGVTVHWNGAVWDRATS